MPSLFKLDSIKPDSGQQGFGYREEKERGRELCSFFYIARNFTHFYSVREKR